MNIIDTFSAFAPPSERFKIELSSTLKRLTQAAEDAAALRIDLLFHEDFSQLDSLNMTHPEVFLHANAALAQLELAATSLNLAAVTLQRVLR